MKKMKINNPKAFINDIVNAGYFEYIPIILSYYGKPLRYGMNIKQKEEMIDSLSGTGIKKPVIKKIINKHVI
ncbi:MAG: hypothetical protein V1663_00800 [archaeon]